MAADPVRAIDVKCEDDANRIGAENSARTLQSAICNAQGGMQVARCVLSYSWNPVGSQRFGSGPADKCM